MPSLLPLGMARDGKRLLWALHLCNRKPNETLAFSFHAIPKVLDEKAVISVENEKKQSFLL